MLSPQSQLVFDDPAALDPADCMLNPHSDAVNATIFFLLFRRQRSTTWFLLWLNDHYPVKLKALKAPILIQETLSRLMYTSIIQHYRTEEQCFDTMKSPLMSEEFCH